jgi:hypothetical protein
MPFILKFFEVVAHLAMKLKSYNSMGAGQNRKKSMRETRE